MRWRGEGRGNTEPHYTQERKVEGLMSDHSFVFKARKVGVRVRGGEEEKER